MRIINADTLEKTLREWIRDHWTEAFTGSDAGAEFADMIDDAETIDAVPSAQPEQRWIPVSERLPEAGKYVLRTIRKFGWQGEEYWSVDIGPYNTNDGSIIAWMPLPEPYMEERTEE